MAKKTEIPFKKVIQALLDADTPFPPRYLYRLSDLPPGELEQLRKIWPNVATRRRQALFEDIADLTEDDYLLDFSSVSWLAIKDPEPEVRALGIHALAEYEEPELVPILLKYVETDSDVTVRAEAARAFGPFVYLGEIEEFPERTFHKIEDCLLKVANGKDAAMVRRRAVEAIGFSSREEVNPLIQTAYDTNDQEWLISALLAMGRSANQEWAGQVIQKLDDARPGVQAEAVSAAGELELHQTLPKLKRLLRSEDDGVRAAAIWSLSQLGGEGVREALEALLDSTEDDDEADLIEAALENLEFSDGEGLFNLIDLSELDLPDGDEEEEPKRPAPKRKKDDNG